MQVLSKRSTSGILVTVLAISLAIHIVGGGVFAVIKIAEQVFREEQTFEVPPIETPPQEQPEYTVNLQRENRESAPPPPVALVVSNPQDVEMPALNIEVSVAAASVYGRGTGGFGSGTGGSSIRPMEFDFFGIATTELNRVVLVVDISGSMVSWSRDLETFDEVVDEADKLLAAIESAGGKFNIVVFGRGSHRFEDRLVTADRKSIDEAMDFFDDYSPAETVRRSGGKSGAPRTQNKAYAWTRTPQRVTPTT